MFLFAKRVIMSVEVRYISMFIKCKENIDVIYLCKVPFQTGKTIKARYYLVFPLTFQLISTVSTMTSSATAALHVTTL